MNDENIFAANTLFVLHINFAIRELLDGDFTQSGTILLSYGTCQGRITGTGEYCERTFQVGLLALKDSGLHKTKGSIPSLPFEFVARGGLEPPHTGPKPGVLPLDDRAILRVIDRNQSYRAFKNQSRFNYFFYHLALTTTARITIFFKLIDRAKFF